MHAKCAYFQKGDLFLLFLVSQIVFRIYSLLLTSMSSLNRLWPHIRLIQIHKPYHAKDVISKSKSWVWIWLRVRPRIWMSWPWNPFETNK